MVQYPIGANSAMNELVSMANHTSSKIGDPTDTTPYTPPSPHPLPNGEAIFTFSDTVRTRFQVPGWAHFARFRALYYAPRTNEIARKKEELRQTQYVGPPLRGSGLHNNDEQQVYITIYS